MAIAKTRYELQRSNRPVASQTSVWKKYGEAKAELAAALVRERELLREKTALLQRQEMLADEFEHRFYNSLQVIVSLLSLQSRATATAEAAARLNIAAERDAAFGRVHRRLHLLDHQKTVEFKQYLQHLCNDLASLLLPREAGRALMVAGMNVKLPAAVGIPLGLIVSELITNSSKYAKGDTTVRIERSGTTHLLSVSDDGPGIPGGLDVAASKGLGMKIVQALVKQIGGTLQFAPGVDGRGTRVTVAFESQP